MHSSYKGCPHISDAEYLERLKAMLIVQPSGCWEKQGFRHPEGYGSMYYRGRQYRSHKLMYMLTKGSIPAGMVVMHTCDNGPCCNPDHLKLGTRAENYQDMHRKGRSNYSKARKTHCKHGHEFTPENTMIYGGFRQCRECNRLRQRRDFVRQEKPPLTRDQLRQQRYRIRRKARLAAQS
jgi:hypothetical protein